MSLLYKQYEQIRELAEDNGADLSNITGTALSKFNQVCAEIITAIGGTFTAYNGGLEGAKADYLYQIAVAVGASPVISGTARERQIQCAHAIVDISGVEFESPIGAQDWRLLYFLSKMTLGPVTEGLLQWLDGDNDGTSVLNDRIDPEYAVDMVQSPALIVNGEDQKIINVTGLTGSDNVTNMGTATPTAGTDEITFTAGSVYGVSVNGTLIYPCSEVDGVIIGSVRPDLYPSALISIGSGNIETIRSDLQNDLHWSMVKGFGAERVRELGMVIQQVTFSDDGTPTTVYAETGIDDIQFDGTYYSQTASSITTANTNGWTDWEDLWDGNTYTIDQIEAWGEWKDNCSAQTTVGGVLGQVVGTKNNARDYSVWLDGVSQYGDAEYVPDNASVVEMDMSFDEDGYCGCLTSGNRFYIQKTSSVWQFGFGGSLIASTESSDNNRHLFRLDAVAKTLSVDGTVVCTSASVISGITDYFILGALSNTGAMSAFTEVTVYGITIDGVQYNVNEGDGTKFYGSDGSSGTWYNGPSWTVTDGQTASLLGGHYVSGAFVPASPGNPNQDVLGNSLTATEKDNRTEFTTLDNIAGEHDFVPVYGIEYPALVDGTDDVAGLGLTNKPIKKGTTRTGIIHNGAITKLKQQDGNEATLGHSEMWYESDTVTEKEVSHGDAKLWISGNDNTWVNFEEEDGVCYWRAGLVYESGNTYTLSEYNRNKAMLPNTCGAGMLEPEYDLDGTVQINLDGSIELVQPE